MNGVPPKCLEPDITPDMQLLPRFVGTASHDDVTIMALHGRISQMDSESKEGFEGPEKRLQLDLRHRCDKTAHALGARAIPKEKLDEMMDLLQAKIVNTIESEETTAHLLTESSLFLQEKKIILITCGTTLLLKALGLILKEIHKLGMDVEWISYSRKNYSFPWQQRSPHSSLAEEYVVLKSHFKFGEPFIFGPIDGDHYFYFLWDDIIRHSELEERDQQLNLVMYDLDPAISSAFFSATAEMSNDASAALRERTGIAGLVKNMKIQDMIFSPCGYSFNAISEKDIYYTMHVTPESHCSYASFETNLSTKSYQTIVEAVLKVFRPGRFTILAIVDKNSEAGAAITMREPIGVEPLCYSGYVRCNYAMNHFGEGYSASKVNYVLESVCRTGL